MRFIEYCFKVLLLFKPTELDLHFIEKNLPWQSGDVKHQLTLAGWLGFYHFFSFSCYKLITFLGSGNQRELVKTGIAGYFISI